MKKNIILIAFLIKNILEIIHYNSFKMYLKKIIVIKYNIQ